jgi:hypothetical protein
MLRRDAKAAVILRRQAFAMFHCRSLCRSQANSQAYLSVRIGYFLAEHRVAHNSICIVLPGRHLGTNLSLDSHAERRRRV